MKSQAIRGHLLFALVLAIAYFLLLPGTHGVFLLDDLPNLKPLERITDVSDPLQIIGYVLSGGATPLGRVIPMTSFALQAPQWPNFPQAFKQVNLLLHLFNGVLLYLLILWVGSFLRQAPSLAAALALFTSAAWVIHPLNISTVFYVVQRMTEMSATFVLLGLLAYLRGRRLVFQGRGTSGYAWATVGVLGGVLLATLCKETGVLLPLYVLVLEFTLFRELPMVAGWRRWRRFCLGGPLAVLFAFGVFHFGDWVMGGYALRPFGLIERLLTESRVLWTYFSLIVVPRGASLGLFQDDFRLSTGLMAPPSTILALGGLVLVIALAFRMRSRYPIAVFGVFWFLGGHLVESSVLPLEIYFEHRNYVPMVGVIYALAAGGVRLAGLPQMTLLKRYGVALGIGWLLAISVVGWQQSVLWGSPAEQAVTWAKHHPDSERAQHNYASLLVMFGDPVGASEIYRRLAERDGGSPGSYLLWLAASCQSDAMILPERDKMMGVLRTSSRLDYGVVGVLEAMVSAREEGGCGGLDPAWIGRSISELLMNPRYATYHSGLYVLAGRLDTALGNPDLALANFDRSLARGQNVEIVLLKIKALASAGRYREAYGLVPEAYAVNQRYSPLMKRESYGRDIGVWEHRLKEQLK